MDNLVPNCTPMEAGFDAVVVDFHAEATAEKMGMGWHIDGRASLVIGYTYTYPNSRHTDFTKRHRIPNRCGHVRML